MAVSMVTNLDDEEKKHIDSIRQGLNQAGVSVTTDQIIPTFNQHPLPQMVVSEANDPQDDVKPKSAEPEMVDIIKGWQGKTRTAKALDFLKEKMKVLSRKNNGASVSLK